MRLVTLATIVLSVGLMACASTGPERETAPLEKELAATVFDLFTSDDGRPDNFGAGCDGGERSGRVCVEVFYATPRAREFGPAPAFVRKLDDRMHLGHGKLLVPRPVYLTKEFGSECPPGLVCRDVIDREQVSAPYERRASIGFDLMSLSASRDIDKKTERQQFIENIRWAVAQSDGKAMVYVHGFNQSFDAAMKTAALLHTDMRAKFVHEKEMGLYAEHVLSARRELGVPIAFSWVNQENPLAYECDSGEKEPGDAWTQGCVDSDDPGFDYKAQDSSPYLSELLELLVEEVEVREINVIVHSMGNRVLLPVLSTVEELAKDTPEARIRLIHAAADIRVAELEDAITVFPGKAKRPNVTATNYSSKTDGALAYSEAVNNLSCRLGRMMFGKKANGKDAWRTCLPFNTDRIAFETVDATSFRAPDAYQVGTDDLGHGYFENSPMVIADIACASAGFRADGRLRSLRKWKIEGKFFYKFASDTGSALCRQTRHVAYLEDCAYAPQYFDGKTCDQLKARVFICDGDGCDQDDYREADPNDAVRLMESAASSRLLRDLDAAGIGQVEVGVRLGGDPMSASGAAARALSTSLAHDLAAGGVEVVGNRSHIDRAVPDPGVSIVTVTPQVVGRAGPEDLR